jgi:hypothetical protein
LAAVLILTAGASVASAFDYADGATAGSIYNATVTSIGNSAGGTSETDNNLMTITGPSSGDGRATIIYDFPTFDADSGGNYIWVVVDGTITGTVKAQVWKVNGVDNKGTKVTLTGSSLSDQFFRLPYTLSADTTITDITVRFWMANDGSKITVDAIATPEPATFVLFGAGLLGLTAWNRRRKLKKKTA